MLAEATILTLYGVTFARLVYKIMNDKPTTNTPWEPQPISAKDFHQGDMHVNINRAPLDQVTGVTFKRALNIKRIAYTPSSSRFASDTADHPESWQAQGTAIVRWLFSEHTTTAEGLVTGATFAFLHDVHLPAPAGCITARRRVVPLSLARSVPVMRLSFVEQNYIASPTQVRASWYY